MAVGVSGHTAAAPEFCYLSLNNVENRQPEKYLELSRWL